MAEQNGPENVEQQVNGFDHRLFDGYDGAASAPPADYIEKLLASAPEAIRAGVRSLPRKEHQRSSLSRNCFSTPQPAAVAWPLSICRRANRCFPA